MVLGCFASSRFGRHVVNETMNSVVQQKLLKDNVTDRNQIEMLWHDHIKVVYAWKHRNIAE